MLDKLKAMTGGNEARMKLYIETFSEALAENLPKLSTAIESNSTMEIRNAVHTLKPLLSIMGFNELWELANRIETNIDTDTDLDEIENLAMDFLQELESTKDEIAGI